MLGKEFVVKEKFEIVQFERVASLASPRLRGVGAGARNGGLEGISPAEPISRKISLDFFKYIPPGWEIFLLDRPRSKLASRF